MKTKLSTITLKDGKIVPWLASSGELAYSPENPPDRDYYFQYGWILPGILSDKTNKRQHFYFGSYNKSDADILFDFWNNARNGIYKRVYFYYGKKSEYSCKTPMAVYFHKHKYFDNEFYIFIQHGSYLILDTKEQAFVEDGYVILYRGIGDEKIYKFFNFDISLASIETKQIIEKLYNIQYEILSDSNSSFNLSHELVRRCETAHIKDDIEIFNNFALKYGEDFINNIITQKLRTTTLECFTLNFNTIDYKFGPNFIKCKTPINNIRITTFFAGEDEVRILDPNRVEFLETVGCGIDASVIF